MKKKDWEIAEMYVEIVSVTLVLMKIPYMIMMNSSKTIKYMPFIMYLQVILKYGQLVYKLLTFNYPNSLAYILHLYIFVL